jgi:type IV pilus assembly protein PilB
MIFKKEDLQLLKELVSSKAIRERDIKRLQESLSSLDETIGIAEGIVRYLGISENIVAHTIARLWNLGFTQEYFYSVQPNMLQLYPESILRKNQIIPVMKIENELTVAVINPPTQQLFDLLKKDIKEKIVFVVITVDEYYKILKYFKVGYNEIERTPGQLGFKLVMLDVESGGAAEQQDKMLQPPAPIAVLEDIILEALKERATDIHLEPTNKGLMVRFRVDGILRRIITLPSDMKETFLSIIKVKANMNQFDKTQPQEGKFTVKIAAREVDIRTNSIPTVNGEKFTMRLLGQSTMVYNLRELGFSDHNYWIFKQLINKPSGLILITGPDSCGKTTTLYSALNEIKSSRTNIVSIEDPVEFNLGLVNQIQVNKEKGFDFATILKNVLRQDANVLLIGDIRDQETGLLACETSLAGHLVFSTLKTNNVFEAISRLTSLGLPPYWTASAISGIVAQRLIRRVCPNCKIEYEPDAVELAEFGLETLQGKIKLFKKNGCDICHGEGYSGRIAVHEVLPIDDSLRDLFYREASILKVKNIALENNFKPIVFDGLRKAFAGVVTLEEVRSLLT